LRGVKANEGGKALASLRSPRGETKNIMLYKLGRFLQLLGLLIAPAGIVGNIVQRDVVTEGTMLAILGAGMGVFAIGWLLQQGGRPAG
jgi:uncharacterized membrane protein YGL010W